MTYEHENAPSEIFQSQCVPSAKSLRFGEGFSGFNFGFSWAQEKKFAREIHLLQTCNASSVFLH